MEENNSEGINAILKEFSGVSGLSAAEKEEELSRQFEHLARKLLTGGYFLINGIRRIYLETIEFYYHEETENGLKDPIMYHTCDRAKRGDLPYFPMGSFNCHDAGIDITFENPDRQYRASFLIRGYRVEALLGRTWAVTKELETRSTYIYDDMLMGLALNTPMTIEWVNGTEPGTFRIGRDVRINVPSYIKKADGYEKECITNEEYRLLPPDQRSLYFYGSGKRYRKCNRQWRFFKIR